MTSIQQTPLESRSLDAVPFSPDREEPIGFVLRLAKALHMYGVPAYELETILSATAAKLGFGLQCLSLPTSITMTLMRKDNPAQTYVIRVAPGEVHLSKLRKANDIAEQVMLGEMSTVDGAQRLKDLANEEQDYPRWLTLVAFVLISSTVAKIFGGGINEMLGAGAAGLALGCLALVSSNSSLMSYLLPATGAMLVTFVAHGTAYLLPGTEPYISVVSGLIILLPGLGLTIAMAELATQNLVSGTARVFGAGTVFLLMAFGTVIGNEVANLAFSEPAAALLEPLPEWTNAAAALMGSLSLVVLFQARAADWYWVTLAGLLAFFSVKIASLYLTTAMAAFVGAVLVGLFANWVAHQFRVPGATMVVPGFIMLVPGSVGFQSMTALLAHDVIAGLDSAFNTILVGVSLVSGLLISSLVTLPKAKGIDDIEVAG